METQGQGIKNNIWFFGDSFTAGDGCIKERPTDGEYFKLKPHGVLWTNGVADHFNMNVINKSVGGASNDWIINSLIGELLKIQPNDIVVVGLSYPERFQLINKKFKIHQNFFPHDFTNDKTELILDNNDRKYNNELFKALKLFVIEYRIQHGDILKEYHHNQVYKILKKIEQSNVKTLLWSVDNRPTYETIDDVIGNEDKHWSWKGHNDWMLKCVELLENNQTEFKPYARP